MKDKSRDIILIITLTMVLLIVNYPFLDNALKNFLDETAIVHVDRIIDGDTIGVTNQNESIRLLGINTPEKGEFYYQEAKDFLESLILDENVSLEFTKEREDKYGRTLAYILFNNTNINVKMVEEGFANYYFYDGRDKYSKSLEDAWNICIENQINLCEPSKELCGECISISPYLYISNSCNFSCNISGWTIKGEGREKVVFNETIKPGEEINFDLDLTNSGKSIYLRDDEGKLVSWKIIPLYYKNI